MSSQHMVGPVHEPVRWQLSEEQIAERARARWRVPASFVPARTPGIARNEGASMGRFLFFFILCLVLGISFFVELLNNVPK